MFVKKTGVSMSGDFEIWRESTENTLLDCYALKTGGIGLLIVCFKYNK